MFKAWSINFEKIIRVVPAPIPIGRKVPNKSNVLKPVSIGAYSPKIKSRFDGLKPGTKTPRAKRTPAKMKLAKLALREPRTKFSA